MGRTGTRRFDGKKHGWLRQGKELAVLVILLAVVFRFLIGVSLVSGDSMSPGLENGDMVLYTRIVKSCEPGDIVVIRMPSGEYYIKRVIAVEGDTVEIRDGQVLVNGQVLEEKYATGATEEEAGNLKYPYRVKSGRVFVLGDNREKSVDSRSFGAVSRTQIRGKVKFFIGWQKK